MASQPLATGWLVENGPRELELLFRAIVFHPAVPILLADDDRHNCEGQRGSQQAPGAPAGKNHWPPSG